MSELGQAEATAGPNDPGPFFHGTEANPQAGNLLVPGSASNLGERNATNRVYFTPSLDSARRDAELSAGQGSAGSTGWNPPAASSSIPI